MLRLLRQRQRQHHHIALGKHLFQLFHKVHFFNVRQLGCKHIHANDPTVKSVKPFCTFLPDIATAHNANLLAPQLQKSPVLCPLMILLMVGKEAALLVKLQYTGHGKLCHRDAVYATGIVNCNASALYFLHRYPIKTGTGQLNQFQILKKTDIVM